MQWWEVPGHLEVKNGDLHLEGYRAQDVVKDLYPRHLGERALFLYSTPWFRHNAKIIKGELKGADVFYAGKALELPEIVRAACEEGLCFDAVSPVEVELALKTGFNPRRVLMTCEASERGMAYAASKGVTINMNSSEQLRDFIVLAERVREYRNADIMLRRNSRQEGAGWTDNTTTIGTDCKFGLMEENIIRAAKDASRSGLNVRGFHHHIGSGFGADSARVFLRHAGKLANITAEAIREGISTIDRIDYGGGFGIAYKEEDARNMLCLPSLHCSVMDQQNDILGSDRKITVIYEPGRRIADCGVMLMRVMRTGDEYIPFIRLNAGFPAFPRPAMYGAYQHIVPLTDTLRHPSKDVQLAGPVCESGDVWTGGKHTKRPMPDLKAGEWVALLNIPYGAAMRMKNYCLFQEPVDVIVDDKGWHEAKPVNNIIDMSRPEYIHSQVNWNDY